MTHFMKPGIAWTLAAAVLAGLSAAPAALAAPPSAMHSGAMHSKKMMAAKTVYVCKDCKAYYSPAMAKKMNYKDGMGHTLVKAGKVPAGYMDGSAKM